MMIDIFPIASGVKDYNYNTSDSFDGRLKYYYCMPDYHFLNRWLIKFGHVFIFE